MAPPEVAELFPVDKSTKFSAMVSIVINASNKLNLSLAYSLGPKPISLIVISTKNSHVRTVLIESKVDEVCISMGYLSSANIMVFIRISITIIVANMGFVHIL